MKPREITLADRRPEGIWEYEVRITRNDIARGKKNSKLRCPIALSCNRNFKSPDRTSKTCPTIPRSYTAWVGRGIVIFYSRPYRGKDGKRYYLAYPALKLSPEGKSFMRRFDSGMEVSPQTIKLYENYKRRGVQ